MNQIIPDRKKELTTKQEKFLSVLFNNGGQVMAAIEEAGYSPDSRGWLMHSVKNEIIERAKTQLAGSSVKAVNRAGISKRQEINIEGQVLHGVVMLPAKDKIKVIGEN